MTAQRHGCTRTVFGPLAQCVLAMIPLLGCSNAVLCCSFLQKRGAITSCAALSVFCSMFASDIHATRDITCLECIASFRPKSGEGYRDFCNQRCEIDYRVRHEPKSRETIAKEVEDRARKEKEKKMEEQRRKLQAEEALLRQKQMEEKESKRKEAEEKAKRKKEEEEVKRKKKAEDEAKRKKKEEEAKRKKKEEEEKALSKKMKKMEIERKKLEQAKKEKEYRMLKDAENAKLREGKRRIAGESYIRRFTCQECLCYFQAIDYREFCSSKCKNDYDKKTTSWHSP